jgi:protein-tyrosine phosphatase
VEGVQRHAFVDCHSHAVPSGDDGAQSPEEGVALCRDAAEHGTALLFATPHVWEHLRLTREREERVRAAYAKLRAAAPLELRLGFEVTPSRALLAENLRGYALEGLDVLLIDTPFVGPLDLLFRLADRARDQGLRSVAAHPERVEAVLGRPELLGELAQAGLLIQVNATSLTGWHGPEIEELAWQTVETGLADLIASDGHRPARPARLDRAFELARERVGEGALSLFDGSALGVAAARETPTREGSQAA